MGIKSLNIGRRGQKIGEIRKGNGMEGESKLKAIQNKGKKEKGGKNIVRREGVGLSQKFTFYKFLLNQAVKEHQK